MAAGGVRAPSAAMDCAAAAMAPCWHAQAPRGISLPPGAFPAVAITCTTSSRQLFRHGSGQGRSAAWRQEKGLCRAALLMFSHTRLDTWHLEKLSTPAFLAPSLRHLSPPRPWLPAGAVAALSSSVDSSDASPTVKNAASSSPSACEDRTEPLSKIRVSDLTTPEATPSTLSVMNVRIKHSRVQNAEALGTVRENPWRGGIGGEVEMDESNLGGDTQARLREDFSNGFVVRGRVGGVTEGVGAGAGLRQEVGSPAEIAKSRFEAEKEGVIGGGRGMAAPVEGGGLGFMSSGSLRRDMETAELNGNGARFGNRRQTPIRRAQRIHGGNSPEGLPLPSTNVIVVTLAACAIALALAISRYKGTRSSRLEYAPRPVAAAVVFEEQQRPMQLLGHFKAEEAPLEDLRPVLADGSVKLRSSAAKAFLQMQGTAKAEGVYLVPLSGFRSVSDQEALFYGVKALRNQQITERAKVSAPPGYSEHHTGYAVDVGDVLAAETHLEFEFEKTEAFKWLQKNANRFHFEMSFPRHNEQGIMYEPWHWRFVGDAHSTLAFHAQRHGAGQRQHNQI